MSQLKYEHEEIVALAFQGESAATIKRWLNLPVGVRQVERVIKRYTARRYDELSPQIVELYRPGPYRTIVLQVLADRGHDQKRCDLCGKRQWKPCAIRFRKYTQRGLDDLYFCCQLCARKEPADHAASTG